MIIVRGDFEQISIEIHLFKVSLLYKPLVIIMKFFVVRNSTALCFQFKDLKSG